MSASRVLLAVLLSSVAVVPLYLLLVLVTGETHNVPLLLFITVIALLISFVGVLVVGLPTHLILVRLDKVKSVNYAIVGFIVPALLTAVFHPFGEDGIKWIAIQSFNLGVFGALIALVFWKVVTHKSATEPA